MRGEKVRLWEAKKEETGLFKAIKAGKKPQKERTTKRATKTSNSFIESRKKKKKKKKKKKWLLRSATACGWLAKGETMFFSSFMLIRGGRRLL